MVDYTTFIRMILALVAFLIILLTLIVVRPTTLENTALHNCNYNVTFVYQDKIYSCLDFTEERR